MAALIPSLTVKRDSTTSSSDSTTTSFSCTGKNSSDPRCQKPSATNALEISLGVGIPVFLIVCVLGVFMFKNYRKEKKESLERDPDFDENGDATALPDFPAFSKEDPFNRRRSASVHNGNGGYPFMHLHEKSAHDLGTITSPVGNDDNSHLDGFVLPYENQIGSKSSLHEFVRTSTDMRLYNHRKSSDYQSLHAPQQNRHIRTDSSGTRGFGGLGNDYASLPNKSTPSLNNDLYYSAKDSSEEGGTSKSSANGDHFGVQYENESDLAINSALPSSGKTFALGSHLKNHTDHDSDLESVIDDSEDEIVEKHMDAVHNYQASNAQSRPSINFQSPFEDKQRESTSSSLPLAQEDASVPAGVNTAREIQVPRETHLPSEALAPPKGVSEHLPKEPRMSQFDMLQNVSDDEGEEQEGEGTRKVAEAPSPKKMTEEQAEELARMKSVYKVYFDRSNSVGSQKAKEDANAAFQADASQPLPSLDVDRLKINSELKGDTAYDRRKTTTSSIYDDSVAADIVDGKVMHPYKQFNVPARGHQQQAQSPPRQQHGQSPRANRQAQSPGKEPGFMSERQQSVDDFQPLKSLPTASDIRNSTLETFTLYQPSLKVTSPQMRNHPGQFEGEAGAPYASQTSFATAGSARTPHSGEVPPMIHENNHHNGSTVPSASQLSRTSVVMLNPVDEIKSSRKFKPAGSLPSGMMPPKAGYANDELSNGEDLIPGNRKSAVRRMMNSNF